MNKGGTTVLRPFRRGAFFIVINGFDKNKKMIEGECLCKKN